MGVVVTKKYENDPEFGKTGMPSNSFD